MMYQTENKKWRSAICKQESIGITDITRHIESKHIENHPGYACGFYDYVTMPSESMRATTHSSPICISLDVSAIIEAQNASLMYQNEAKMWICSVCFKESPGKTNITRHIGLAPLDTKKDLGWAALDTKKQLGRPLWTLKRT